MIWYKGVKIGLSLLLTGFLFLIINHSQTLRVDTVITGVSIPYGRYKPTVNLLLEAPNGRSFDKAVYIQYVNEYKVGDVYSLKIKERDYNGGTDLFLIFGLLLIYISIVPLVIGMLETNYLNK